jgi:hypothetical protein
MGGQTRQIRPGCDQAVNPRLAELIASGRFDWDDGKHREAYLRAWVNGTAPPPPQRTERADG